MSLHIHDSHVYDTIVWFLSHLIVCERTVLFHVFQTNIFRGIDSLNTTDETDIEEAETTTEQKTVEIVGYNVNGTDIEC